MCTCDDIEACATDVLGCTSGCSGAAAGNLIKFMSCFEGEPEGARPPEPDPAKLANCSAAAGVSVSAMNTCVADKARVLSLHKRVQAQKLARKVTATPDFRV